MKQLPEKNSRPQCCTLEICICLSYIHYIIVDNVMNIVEWGSIANEHIIKKDSQEIDGGVLFSGRT